ncbi:MAG: STAS domain-containing protein [Chitinispirillaceae bacterium]|nr:STAS domain-containing protein [Chitinispirillaceae bacterium]
MQSKTVKMRKAVPADLSVAVKELKGWHCIVLTGKFVVKTIALVRKVFDSLQSGKNLSIALDLTGVTQIDSSALTVMLNLQKQLQQKSGRMALIGPNEVIKETLFMVGFNLAVPVYNTRAEFEQSVCPK